MGSRLKQVCSRGPQGPHLSAPLPVYCTTFRSVQVSISRTQWPSVVRGAMTRKGLTWVTNCAQGSSVDTRVGRGAAVNQGPYQPQEAAQSIRVGCMHASIQLGCPDWQAQAPQRALLCTWCLVLVGGQAPPARCMPARQYFALSSPGPSAAARCQSSTMACCWWLHMQHVLESPRGQDVKLRGQTWPRNGRHTGGSRLQEDSKPLRQCTSARQTLDLPRCRTSCGCLAFIRF